MTFKLFEHLADITYYVIERSIGCSDQWVPIRSHAKTLKDAKAELTHCRRTHNVNAMGHAITYRLVKVTETRVIIIGVLD